MKKENKLQDKTIKLLKAEQVTSKSIYVKKEGNIKQKLMKWVKPEQIMINTRFSVLGRAGSIE